MAVTYKSNLHRIRAGLKAAIGEGLHQGAEHIGDLAEQLAPEDTGDLKASKTVEQVSEDHWRVSFGRGLPDIRAIAQEYGTRYAPAQPYLTPASRAIDVDLEVGKAVDKLIRSNGL